MNHDKYHKFLKGCDDEQLKKTSEKMKLSRRFMRDKISKVWEAYWKMKYLERDFQSMDYGARVERGRRKGQDCPALGKDENGRYYHAFECKARNTQFAGDYHAEGVYRKFCSTCRLTHEKAKNKMVYKKIFNPVKEA